MGILTWLGISPRDKPVNSTAGSVYSFFMGSSSAGKRVNTSYPVSSLRNRYIKYYKKLLIR